jgi:RHS repeat-associated protein
MRRGLSFARPSSVSVAASRKASRASTAIGAKPATAADDDAAGVDGDLVQLTVRDGVRWGYSLAGAAVGTPILRGSVAHYADVLPNVDLELAALSSGVKETLTLRSADVPSEYIYPLRLDGLTARIADDGSAEFVDASGDVAVWMPLGYLEDSAVDASGVGAMSHAMTYEIVTANGRPALKMSVDGSWLRDPARTFPVKLDPTGKVNTTTSDTYVQTGASQAARTAEDNVAVGTFNGTGGITKTLLPFSTFGTTYAGKKLSAADLNVFMSYQGIGGPCVAKRFDVARVTQTWSAATVTYSTYPTASASIGNASPTSAAACANTATTRNVGTWVSVPMNATSVNDWVTGGPNWGLALTASETEPTAFKRFTSANSTLNCTHATYGNIACDPFIDVTYTDNVAPQVTARYPANNYAVSTLTPELAARGTDTDNWPAKGLRYNFFVYDDKGTQIKTSGWVTGGVWRVPAGTLVWGKTYLYAVQVNDYSSTGPAVPETYAFSTQVPQPPVTSSLAQNGGKGYEASAGNYTTSDVDAQVATAGPALSVNRDYNSLDTRSTSAFGRGWSSILDMQLREGREPDGTLTTATVRYPNGQEVTFGRNNDGTWAPPSGRYSVFKAITGGYSLTDKDATSYEFTQAAGTNAFGLTKVVDAAGRALTMRYTTDGLVDQLTSASSNRTLAVAWSTPSGSAYPHVSTVSTDPVNHDDPTSKLTWSYSYDEDRLAAVCPPGAGTACERYDYTWVSQHANAVLNASPYSFWRLNEPVGTTTASSSVLSNDGTDNGTYTDVALGGSPSLPNSTATSASFNGTSSAVSLPPKVAVESSYQSISLWFKTATPLGVLFSYQRDAVAPGATTTGNYLPTLYIDAAGKLRGELYTGDAGQAMASPGPVTDDRWHHAVLAGHGSRQQLYLDGQQIGDLSGAIVVHTADIQHSYVGAGYLGGTWPGHTLPAPTATYFTGSIADVAFYNRGLTAENTTALYDSGRTGTAAMSKHTSNAGRVQAEVDYDAVSGRVSEVTDETGGVWKIGAPTTTGSSQVYVSSVLGSQPRDYFRLGDTSAPATAVNQVVGNTLKYSNVTFDTSQPNSTSPFADTYGAVFNGTSSHARMDGWDLAPGLASVPESSVELWFKTPANHAKSSVLYAYQDEPVESAAVTTSTPALYIGGDGYLRGGFLPTGVAPITSTVKVNDGAWHHVVLSAFASNTVNRQTLYLDNKTVGTKAAGTAFFGADISYIGAGTTKGWAGSTSDKSYFKGNIAEYAHYDRELTAAAVDAHYKASRSALPPPAGATGPVLTPISTTTVTGPGGKTSKQMFDVVNGNRLIAETDTLGNTTSYGFDVGGFVSVVYDPLGRKTESGKDVRGNTVRSTTCAYSSIEIFDQCQTTQYKYWPDATTTNLTPDARNDQLTEVIDPRAGLDSDRYRTSFVYDTAGNRTSMTTPPVPDFPAGRTTTMTYTTAATPAVGGGITPAGLPLSTRSAGGAEQRTDYNAAGDTVRVTDPAGLVTEFGYDGLGRVSWRKVVSDASPEGQTTTFVYDDEDLAQTTEPSVTNRVTGAVHTARTTDTFDADGNVTSRTVADLTGGDSLRATTSAYNARGQMVKSVDPAGSVTLFEYDAYGNQSREVSCDSSPAPTAACPSGDVLRMIDQVYDSEGQLLSRTLTGSDGTATRLTFNAYFANGALASETDAMNWTTKYDYWADDTVKKVTRTDGVKNYVVEENTYDDAGNVATRTENNGATFWSYTYDAAGRLQSSWANGTTLDRIVNQVYDADDRVTVSQHVDNSGPVTTALQTVRNTYDAMGRTTSERIGLDGATGPAGWWKLDGTSSADDYDDVFDSSAFHHDATGAAKVSLGGGFATSNGGNISTLPVVDTTKSYSVSAWVRAANLTTSQIAVSQTAKANTSFALKYDKALNKWAFSAPATDVASPATTYNATSGTAVTANTWAHLVGVFDASTKKMSIYVNNVAGTAVTNPTPIAVAGEAPSFNMAGPVDGTFAGSIDNVQLFQRALSMTDVSTLYGAGNGRTASTTIFTKELTTDYTVDDRGLTTAAKDPKGNVTNYEYDEAGRSVQQVDPSVPTEVLGGAPIATRPVSKTGYNTFGEPVETQDPLGNVTQSRVDALGRPWKTILPDYTPPGGTPIVGANITTAYDKLGQVLSETDARGRTTSYGYDSLGNRTQVTDAAGKITTALYNKAGDLVETVDPIGAKSTATYDYLGRKVTSSQVVRQPSPQTYTSVYDYGTGTYGNTPAAGPWLRKVTSPDGVPTSYTYNDLGEELTVADGAGNTTTNEYDGLGRVTKVTNPDQTKQASTYDGSSRLTRAQELDTAGAVARTTSAEYDDNGNIISSTDGRNTKTTFAYDALDNIVGETQPITATSAVTTSFGYDAAGKPTRFTDGRGNPFWTTYNSWGLAESQVEPATAAHPDLTDRTFTTAYDATGRAIAQMSPGGVRVESEYDDLGRLRTQTGTGAEALDATRTLDYDDAGRVTALSVPGGTNTLSYDDRGLPLAITGPNDTSSFSYTKDGRMASRQDAAGTTSYGYDTAGRFKTAANATTGINVAVGYNTMSLPTTVTSGTAGNARTLTYDALHRLKTDILKTANGATTLGSITYGYDANDNETSKVTTGFAGSASNAYGYDLADRLTSWTSGATTTAYAYDGSGNRTQVGSKTFTYDARNQLLAQLGTGAATYDYTARGTLKHTVVGSMSYETKADAFGQVVSQHAPGGASTYEYDALGRAVKPGFKYTGPGNTLAADGQATYTRGPGGEVLGEGGGTGAGSVYAWTDQHRDVVGQFTATGTTMSGSTSYDPLGAVLASTGLVGGLGYQSEWTDAVTDRVNMHARWYNTDTGQFDTRDTAGVSPMPDSVQANRFQYGDANPLTTVDPTGHWGMPSFKSVFSAVSRVVTQPVRTFQAVSSYASQAFNYVSSGRAWNDVKAGTKKIVKKVKHVAKKVASKAKKAWKVVKDTTVRWVKKKANAVKDAYHSAKKCLNGGVKKCVKETAKKAVKKAVATVKNTVEAIKKDPWKFVATAAVGIAAAVAVGALCATGIGCLLVAGAVAGAMSAGAGYMVDVSRGDQDFSWSGLAGTMIEGGLDGALSAGISRFTGGATRALGGAAKATGGAAASRLSGLAARGGSSAGRSRSAAPPARSAERPAQGRSGGPGCPTPTHSFAPETRVLLADGSTKPIGDVTLGDKVAASDPETGATEAKQVTLLHINEDRDLTDVTVKDTDTGDTTVLKTTQNHPFWDATDRQWVDASKLKTGHRLLPHDDKRQEGDDSGAGSGGGGPGADIEVVKVVNYSGSKIMRDLTVADIHTYYVLAGNTPVLVHNCGGLDWSRAKVNEGGVNAVERHLSRFTDGGPLEPAEQGMLNRLRGISSGDLEATPHDLRFYTHELRESVLYRKAGHPTGQPEVDSYELWDQLHTKALKDYGLTRASAPNDLYHPSVR